MEKDVVAMHDGRHPLHRFRIWRMRKRLVGAKGAQFSLMHNFGWKNPADEEESGPAVKIINDIPMGATVNINTNTETAQFDPLHKPESPAEAVRKVSDAEGGQG